MVNVLASPEILGREDSHNQRNNTAVNERGRLRLNKMTNIRKKLSTNEMTHL